MKIKHNAPVIQPRSAPVAAGYQAEVDRATGKAAAACARAQRRLTAAEARLAKAEVRNAKQLNVARRRLAERELKVASELVELRREELQQIEALMKAAPASAEHRGVRGFRPVPKPGGTF